LIGNLKSDGLRERLWKRARGWHVESIGILAQATKAILPARHRPTPSIAAGADTTQRLYTLRRVLARMNALDAMPLLIDRLMKTDGNKEFLDSFRLDD
jgi:hypothetical protein